MDDAELLLNDLAAGMPAEERLILCGFRGDPNTADPTAWRPRPWRIGAEIPFEPEDNAYVAVSSFKRAPDGTFRRRGSTFGAGLALMVDDVGTKVARETVSHAEPTFRIETSRGNEQWWYLLDKRETDAPRFDGIIRAFISAKLLGEDPGMSGVTRVGRLPGFTNAKKKHNNWPVHVLSRGSRWTQKDLIDAFGLTIVGRREPRTKLHTEQAIIRNRAFATFYKWLDNAGMLKRKEPDLSGWTEMRCPWIAGHTDKADTGAAIREPSPENDYYGAFRCHHGHCADKGWAELTEWINEESVEYLADINNAAGKDAQ